MHTPIMPEQEQYSPPMPDAPPGEMSDPHPGGRVPPQAVDIEQAVLGAILLERDALPQTVEILSENSFYDGRHRKIFAAFTELFRQGVPIDLITLTEELRRRKELDKVGGADYLNELTSHMSAAANVEYHARIIAQKHLLRQMIEKMTLLVRDAYDPGTDTFELLDKAETDIFQISNTGIRRPAAKVSDIITTTIENLEAIHGREGGVTGVPSGFSRLDNYTSGWQRSDLIVVAARPSMGKTAFALTCARNAALHKKYPAGVAVFSLEMGAEQLALRMLTSEARVDSQDARTGRMKDNDWQKLARAAGQLAKAPIFIDDTPGLSVLELRAKCRRLKAEHDIGLVIVDYLQLMHVAANQRYSSREQEISHISRSMKAMAKELDIPVIALSQLSRAVETRGGDKRPQLSDLRESGAIEQDADVVCFIYRPERVGITKDEQGNSLEGIAEIIIGKQRNGPVGTVELSFVKQYARFESLATYYQTPAEGDGARGEDAPF